MFRTMLRSKIAGLTITGKELHYDGSITLDEDLLDRAGILVGERVEVLNLNNGARFATYAIAGERGSGCVMLNGAAARLGEVGDKLIVLCYALVEEKDAAKFNHRLVRVDEKNRAVR
jgi:aspartate 1-decarboxylase